MIRILKLIYFPTITTEETYSQGGGGVGVCSEIVFLAGFRKSAPGLCAMLCFDFQLLMSRS